MGALPACECETRDVPSGSWRRILEPRAAIKILPIVAAVVAAVGAFVLHGIADDEWDWVQLGDDLIRNLLLGGLLTAAVVWLEEEQRAREKRAAAIAASRRKRERVLQLREVAGLAASAWSPLEAPDDSQSAREPARVADDLLKEAAELRKSADELEEILKRESDDRDVIFDLFVLAGVLQRYLKEGGRTRRFVYFDVLQRELSGLLTGTDGGSSAAAGRAPGADRDAVFERDIAAAADSFRASVVAVVAWKAHTDATVLERLLVEKIIDGPKHGLAPPERRELLDAVQLDQAAVVEEPLYLLHAYALVHRSDRTTDAVEAKRRVEPTRRCVGALRNEMRARATALERLRELIEASANSLHEEPRAL